MKKAILFISAVAVLAVNPAIAKHIDAVTAQLVAQNYLMQTARISGVSMSLQSSKRSASGIEDYYVFDVNNKGFIIISSEDAGHPVIGYSMESAYVEPTASSNPNYFYWIEKRKAEIEYMRDHDVKADAIIRNEWKLYSDNNMKVTPPSTYTVGALCSTTWNQSGGGGTPYNNLCPGGSVTGCVATAMAQIMKKWGSPSTGTGSSSYTQSPNPNGYAAQSANYGATTYNWGSMPNATSSSDVATLMYHCGVSVQMNYDPSGSGAYVSGGNPSAQYAYVNYFGYSSGIHNVTRAGDATWVADLKTEFDNGRPVQYYGYTVGYTSGHSWVGDGYDASDNIHMNWGWGGFDNGFYAVNNLAPPGTGYDFSTGDGALLGIQPAGVTGPSLKPASCGITVTNLYDQLSYYYLAGATYYQVRVSDQASSFVGYVSRLDNNFALSLISGIGFGKTYNVDVRAYVAGVWGNFGPVCTVTTPGSIPTTQLAVAYCGITESTLADQLSCNSVSGATNYGYRVSNAASSFTVTYTSSNSNIFFQMNSVSGIQFGKTYNVEVRAYVGGVWGNYGSVCTVTTPGSIPTTQLAPSSCNVSLATTPQTLWCNYVPGATNYQYRVSNAASSYTTTYTKPSDNQSFSLVLLSGIQHSTTYNVEVRASVGGVWGNFSTICTVTTPAVGSVGPADPGSFRTEADGSIISIFPNPVIGEELNLTMSETSTSGEVRVEISNLTGEKMFSRQLSYSAGDIITLPVDKNLPGGIYFVTVVVDGRSIHQKFIIGR